MGNICCHRGDAALDVILPIGDGRSMNFRVDNMTDSPLIRNRYEHNGTPMHSPRVNTRSGLASIREDINNGLLSDNASTGSVKSKFL